MTKVNSNNYTISQDFKYEGEDWWSWWIWIEGNDKDLDAIQHVIYTLHSTFRNPVRTIADRQSKFKLLTEGWGTFTIYARIFLKNGEQIQTEHELYLEYPDGKQNVE